MKESFKMTDYLLLEVYKVERGVKDANNNQIAYIDTTLPQNNGTYQHKDILISPEYRGRWDAPTKRIYWYLGKDEGAWKYTFDKFIKPALEIVYNRMGETEESSKESFIEILNTIMRKVEATKNDNVDIKDRLKKFKDYLVNIDNDEEFKETMKTIINFKNSQGHKHSMWNTILIYLQNPNAKMVKSKFLWNEVNRYVKPDAKPILILSPSKNNLQPYSEAEKREIFQKFLKGVNKKRYEELTPGEKEQLIVLTRGKLTAKIFDLTQTFDIKDTEVLEGKPDLVDKESLDKYEQIKWFEEGKLDDSVKPLYNALLTFAQNKNISISFEDDLGGSRGSSAGGQIKLLKNEGNDVGLTKTLCHELLHEILHQNYLKTKDKEMETYFVGKEEGRAAVEQQAELGAWMVMAEYGFDMKTTSINYVLLWGGDKEKMIRVYELLSSSVNYLLRELDMIMSNNNNNETEISEEGDISDHHVTPLEIAQFIGMEDEYLTQLKKEQGVNKLMEDFKRINKIL